MSIEDETQYLPDFAEEISAGKSLRTINTDYTLDVYVREGTNTSVVHLHRECEAGQGRSRSFGRWRILTLDIEKLPSRLCARCNTEFKQSAALQKVLLTAAVHSTQDAYTTTANATSNVQRVLMNSPQEYAYQVEDQLDKLGKAIAGHVYLTARFTHVQSLLLAATSDRYHADVVKAMNDFADEIGSLGCKIQDTANAVLPSITAAQVVESEFAAVTGTGTVPVFTTRDSSVMHGWNSQRLGSIFTSTCQTRNAVLINHSLFGAPPKDLSATADSVEKLINGLKQRDVSDIEQVDFCADEPITIKAGTNVRSAVTDRWLKHAVPIYRQAFAQWNDFVSKVAAADWPPVTVTSTRTGRTGLTELLDETRHWNLWLTAIDIDTGTATWTVPHPVAEHMSDQICDTVVTAVNPQHRSVLSAIETLRPTEHGAPLRSWTARATVVANSMGVPIETLAASLATATVS